MTWMGCIRLPLRWDRKVGLRSAPMVGDTVRIRREPPRFRRVEVASIDAVTPRMAAVRFRGGELAGLTVNEPAASVRLLVPTPGDEHLVIPTWSGNEFLRPDGSRPIIRTFTPRRLEGGVLTLEIVLHEGGVVSEWVERADVGDPAAVSGTGRGYAIDPAARAFFLAGDESAIPAISQLLEALPDETPVQVIIEIADAARVSLPHHPHAGVTWVEREAGAPPGDGLAAAVTTAEISDGTKVWVAGEAAAMHRVRKHLFDERGTSRRDANVRGYWKHGRAGSDD